MRFKFDKVQGLIGFAVAWDSEYKEFRVLFLKWGFTIEFD